MTGLFKNLSLSRCFPRGRRLGETVRGCLTDRAGIAAVEFGMVLPMFLLFLSCISVFFIEEEKRVKPFLTEEFQIQVFFMSSY